MNREIKYRDCIVSQASNNHVMIIKDGESVFHSRCNKKLSDEELKRAVDNYLDTFRSLFERMIEDEKI